MVEEYREIKPYYTTRLSKIFIMNDTIPVSTAIAQIRFTNGYDYKVLHLLQGCHLEKRTGRTKWGAESGKEHYVLVIEKITWKSIE